MKNKSLILNIILPIIIALTCFFPIASYTTNVEHHQKNIEYIDSKKTTVLELTATSAALSVAIDMIPGDTGSSIANALASLTTKFGIVLGALYLEKYLLTLLAYIAFKWIIPICCGAWIVQYLLHIHFFKQSDGSCVACGYACVGKRIFAQSFFRRINKHKVLLLYA